MKPSKIPPNTIINVPQINGPTLQISYQELIQELSSRAQIQKYGDALASIKASNNPSMIPQILSNNNVSFKNNKMYGGIKKNKKTKKNKKQQKGGFHYKMNSKRKSLLTSFKKSKTNRTSK